MAESPPHRPPERRAFSSLGTGADASALLQFGGPVSTSPTESSSFRGVGRVATAALRLSASFGRRVRRAPPRRDGGRELESVGRVAERAVRAPRDVEGVARTLLDELAALFDVGFVALTFISDDGREASGFLARSRGRDLDWWREVRLDLEREPSGIASAVFEASAFTVYDATHVGDDQPTPRPGGRGEERRVRAAPRGRARDCRDLRRHRRRAAASSRRRISRVMQTARVRSGRRARAAAGECRARGCARPGAAPRVDRAAAAQRPGSRPPRSRAPRRRRVARSRLRPSASSGSASRAERCRRPPSGMPRRRGRLETATSTESSWPRPRRSSVRSSARTAPTPSRSCRSSPSSNPPAPSRRAVLPCGRGARASSPSLEAVAAEIGIALRLSRLLEENEERLAQQAALLRAAHVAQQRARPHGRPAAARRPARGAARRRRSRLLPPRPGGGRLPLRRRARLRALTARLRVPGERRSRRRGGPRGTAADRRARMPRSPSRCRIRAYEGFTDVIVAPMAWSDDVQGVLGVGGGRGASSRPGDADVLEAFAGLASLAVRNAETFTHSARQARIQRGFYRIASVARPVALARCDAGGGRAGGGRGARRRARPRCSFPRAAGSSRSATYELPPELARLLDERRRRRAGPALPRRGGRADRRVAVDRGRRAAPARPAGDGRG